MSLASGTKLGPYEIQSQLGAGGMGEVYRARDTRLDRTVAIKILASHLASSPELKQRMEREARAISALNHPNICHLYDIGSQDGTDYLVMQFLEGETLAHRLLKGAMPFNETLRVAIAIGEALASAHAQGIVHRDLKPGNIMLTKTGARLMDFGLAKPTASGLSGAASSAPLLSAARTMTEASPVSPVTTVGTMVGTIQYMSPEQIEGKEADARSDIFAFGAVLYETLTGGRPFEGKSQLSLASAILEKEPERISAVQPLTPPALEHVITTCLAKSPEERYQTARDVVIELKWIAQSGMQPPAPPQQAHSSRESIAWAIAGAITLLALACLLWWHASTKLAQTNYFSALLPFAAHDVAISPNGHTVAVIGHLDSQRNNSIWIYEPGSQDAKSIPNTEGATFPFWSADGQSIGFFAEGKLKRLDLAGGPVQTLADAPSGRGGTWNRNGDIVFTPSGHLGVGLYRISASGGTPTQITSPDESQGKNSDRWPSFLPDGVHYLYSSIHLAGQQSLVSVLVGELGSAKSSLVATAGGDVAYVAPGYLLFYRDETLFAQHFDTKALKVTGEPIPLLSNVQYSPRISKAVYAAVNTRLLVAQQGGDPGASQLLWYDRKGQEVGRALGPGIYGNISLSPDGKAVAVDSTDSSSQNTDVWIHDLSTGSKRHLTFDPAIDTVPIWSPDESRVVFASNRGVNFKLYIKDTNGAQDEKEIPQDGPDRFPNDWSRDGKYILYERASDLWYLRVSDQRESQFLKASSTLRGGRFSPDGKWVAYASTESGRWETYVTSFPEAHGKWQISTNGGNQPKWRADGKELFYMSSEGHVMAVPVKTGVSFEAGTPVELFQADSRETIATSEQFTYDVSSDGQKFLINTQLTTAQSPMTVVLNWGVKFEK